MRDHRSFLSFSSTRALISIAVAWLLAISARSGDAHASTSIALTVTDLARSSNMIARVTSLERKSDWEDGRIVTTTRVRVDAVLAGPAEISQTLSIRTRGGIVGSIGQAVEGEADLAAGSSAILFLARSDTGREMRVVGRAQGRWAIARDASSREIVHVERTGLLVPRRGREALGTLATSLDGARIEDAAREATAAWSATHGR